MAAVSDSGPNVSWLDQQLRKERGRVAELQDLVDEQQVVLVDQAQRISSLEERLSRLEGQLKRIPQVEQNAQHVRDEVALMVSELREERDKRMTNFLRNRQTEREKDQRALNEMAARLEPVGELEQALAVARAEIQRINEAVMRLSEETASTDERFADLEENERKLADDIAKNQVVTARHQDLLGDGAAERKEHSEQLLSLADRLTKLEQGLAELRTMREELTEQQEELVERERRADRARAQKLAEWERRVDDYGHQLETWSDQLRFFSDQHEKNRRVLRDIQTLAQEIGQRQDQLRQLQRVSEEQLRRDLREWRSETEQRWAKERERHQRRRELEAEREREVEGALADLDLFREQTSETLQSIDRDLDELRNQLLAARQAIQERQAQAWALLGEAIEGAFSDISAVLPTGQDR